MFVVGADEVVFGAWFNDGLVSGEWEVNGLEYCLGLDRRMCLHIP